MLYFVQLSLEIEGQNHHLCRAAIHAMRELEHTLVCEVGAMVVDDVAQPEAEFQFGNEFEIRKIEVTTTTYLYVAV